MSILANSLFFGAPSDGVIKPSITSPLQGSVGVSLPITFTSSAYTYVGTATTHASSDWRLFNSTNTNSSPVASVTNSAADKTTWTVGNLSLSTNYWAQVRYRSTTGHISDWSDLLGFATTAFLPPLVNGSQTFYTGQVWTVPAQIGTVRVYLKGAGYRSATSTYSTGYAEMQATFDVVPGEQFWMGPWLFGVPVNGGVPTSHATCWGAVGNPGLMGVPSSYSDGQKIAEHARFGGRPTVPNAEAGRTGAGPGQGATQTGGGAGGSYLGDTGGNGGPLSGGACGQSAANGNEPGSGGTGWYGGGGPAQLGMPGGGGSSKFNIPANRNPVINTAPQWLELPGNGTNYYSAPYLLLTW